MRTRKLLKLSLLALLPISLLSITFFGDKKQSNKVEAYEYYTKSTLPTTIDLNDTSESAIRSYYSSLNNKNLNGTNLLKALKPILKNNQKYFSYDNSSSKECVWMAYEITDRDWDLSPASQISGYNSTTKKITGYTYKASTDFSNSNNPYLHTLYVNRDFENPIKAWGNHNQTYGGINQEHIWPKSHGFDAENAGGARGDLMHLWSGDGYTNKTHSNYSYGNVDKTKAYKSIVQLNSSITYAAENFLGISKRLGSGTVFEPQDCDKGDIARSLFYMAARYNNYAGDTTGIDSNDPYLVLKDVVSVANESGSTCTATEPGEYGILSDLLEWNRLDPVDEFEIHRNNILFNNYSMNRNPFIDFPQWAEIIWGGQSGVASPATDSINNDKTVVSLTLTGNYQTEFSYNSTFNHNGLVVTANYDDSTTKDVTDLATFSTPNMTQLGSQTITVSYGGKSATYSINVSNYLASISLSGSYQTTFNYKDTFNHDGVVVTAKMANGQTSDVTASATFSTPNMKQIGQQTVNVTYQGKKASYVITIKDYLVSISLSGTQKTEFKYGETFNSNGLVVKTTMASGAFTNIDSGYTVSTPNMNVLGEQTITVTYEGKTATYKINIVNYVADIELSGDYPTTFALNADFSIGGMIVNATMADGTIVEDVQDYVVISPDTSFPGNQYVVVMYEDVSITYVVTIQGSILDVLQGCLGSTISASVGIFLFASLSLGLILFKKRKEN